MYSVHDLEHPLAMAVSTPQIAVKSLLANERDAHRRQRELVRASLMLCPGKTAAHPAQR